MSESTLIALLTELELGPAPNGPGRKEWTAVCPDRSHRHYLKISTEPDAWECEFCGQQGNYQQFWAWVNRLYLSEYMAAIKSGGEIPEYLAKWWWRRY